MNTIRCTNYILLLNVPLTFAFISLFLLSFSIYPHYYHSLALENYAVLGNASQLKATKTPTLAENLSLKMDYKNKIGQNDVKNSSYTNFYPNKTYTLIGKNIDLDIAPDKRVLSWTF